MTTDNPTVLLAYQRARHKTAVARAERARAKLGVEKAVRSEALSPSARFERDRASLRKLAKIWRRRPSLMPGEGKTTIVRLPSGRTVVWDWEEEKWVNA